MNKETIAVLGGSGFIGSHVVDKLDEIGFSVKILDRKINAKQKEKYQVFESDILDRHALDECISGAKYVFNFAGIADIKEASAEPLKTIEKNIMGSTYAIEASLNAKVKKYLYASTMYVYSDRGGFYRTTKQASEDIICSYNEKYGIEYLDWIDAPKELKNFDISICMSYHEGLPRVVLESLYIGLYTISNNLPGLRPIFDTKENGKLIHENNLEEFKQAIIDYPRINNLDERIAYSRKKMKNNFSTEKILDEFVNVYKKL